MYTPVDYSKVGYAQLVVADSVEKLPLCYAAASFCSLLHERIELTNDEFMMKRLCIVRTRQKGLFRPDD